MEDSTSNKKAKKNHQAETMKHEESPKPQQQQKWLMIVIHADSWEQESAYMLPWPDDLPMQTTFHVFPLVQDWGSDEESATSIEKTFHRLSSSDDPNKDGWDTLKENVETAAGLELPYDYFRGPCGGQGYPAAIHGIVHVNM